LKTSLHFSSKRELIWLRKLVTSTTSKFLSRRGTCEYLFSDPNPTVWTVDLKNGSGAVKKGKEGTADATFTLTDEDATGLFDGSLKPNTLFMQGKMKIKGNMQAAMKFTPDLFPKSPKL
jgi:alkyl sulfatase BDS1-like metallo-beta-lactamase superfamily hydrolase